MPILSMFPGGGGGSGGVPLPPVTNIIVQPASKKVYLKWTDPEDLADGGTTYAEWAGTVVVRKAGSAPENRFDGTVVATSTTRNEHQNTWLVDENGLVNGTTYYYHIYPFSTGRVYTDDASNVVSAKPAVTKPDKVSNVTVVSAGNGKISIKWTDPDELKIESGDVVVSRWDNTRVLVKSGSAPTYSSTVVDYRGDFTTRNSHNNTPLIIDGLTNGTKYNVRIYTHNTDDGTNYVTKTVTPNKLQISTVPSQKNAESLIYNGNNQTPEWNDYDTEELTLSVVAQKNAGTYTATFTPKEDYVWADGETDEEKSGPKTVNWTIQKAAGVLSVDPASVTLDADHTSVTATITKTFDGTIAVSSSDTTVATVTLSGNTVTINSVNDTTGSATVTISPSGGSNYTVPSDTTISVSAVFKAVAYTSPQTGVTYTDGINYLSGDEMNEIAEAISNNSAITNTTSEVWIDKYNRHISIGDGTLYSIGSEYSTRFEIMGFNHYTLSDSTAYGNNTNTGKAGMLLQQSGCYKDAQEMMSRHPEISTQTYGWHNSDLRTWLNSTLYGMIESEIASVIKSVKILTAQSVKDATINETNDMLFAPAYVELFGTAGNGMGGVNEGTRYAYYITNNDLSKSASGGYVYWWMRSPYGYSNYNARFYLIKPNGSADYGSSTQAPVYVSPCFCI